MGVTVRDTKTGALRHFFDARQARILIALGHATLVDGESEMQTYPTRNLTAETAKRRGRPPKQQG